MTPCQVFEFRKRPLTFCILFVGWYALCYYKKKSFPINAYISQVSLYVCIVTCIIRSILMCMCKLMNLSPLYQQSCFDKSHWKIFKVCYLFCKCMFIDLIVSRKHVHVFNKKNNLGCFSIIYYTRRYVTMQK